MKHTKGVSRKLRVFVLLALLLTAPAAMAADPTSEPSWIDVIQNWFETLLGDDPETTDEDNGTLHIPGG
ncbi:MAG: hypothetical protein ACSLFQ_21080 [Thermoanaerobaculia bacterium]